VDFYTGHDPVIQDVVGKDGNTYRIYQKCEKTDDFLFKKTDSISINAEVLEQEQVDGVVISIPGRNVVIMKNAEEIMDYNDVRTYNGERKYYLPIQRWEVRPGGDPEWVKKLLMDKRCNKLSLRASRREDNNDYSGL